MTDNSTLNSTIIPLEQAFGCAIQAVWTGTPNGTIKLQASCDLPVNNIGQGSQTVTNWTDIANTPQVIAGSSGNFMWNITSAMYRYVRLTYTNTSGSGTLNAVMCVKGA